MAADAKGNEDFETVAKMLVDIIGGASFDLACVLKLINEFQGVLHINVLRMLRSPKKSYWIAAGGGLNAVLGTAIFRGLRQLKGYSNRQWGHLHPTTFPNKFTTALKMSPGTGFDLPSLPTGGDTNTPCQRKIKSLDDLSASSSNISLRFVADMSDLRHGCSIITPVGQCAVLGSPFYGQDVEKWYKGEMRKVNWVEEDVRAAAKFSMLFNGKTIPTRKADCGCMIS